MNTVRKVLRNSKLLLSLVTAVSPSKSPQLSSRAEKVEEIRGRYCNSASSPSFRLRFESWFLGPLRSLHMPPPKQQAFPPPTPVPPAPAPLAKKQVRKGRLKSLAALRNAEMERALRLHWSALLERERDMLIAGAHSPARHVSEQ